MLKIEHAARGRVRRSLILLLGVVLTHYGWLVLQAREDADLREENRRLRREMLRIRELQRDLAAVGELNEGLRRTLDLGLRPAPASAQQALSGRGNGLGGGPPVGSPVEGRLSRGFEQAEWPGAASHPGVDLATRKHEAVLASAGGQVIFRGETSRWGWLVLIDHEEDWISWYGHLDPPLCRLGDRVSRGELIGRVAPMKDGGAHLHYALQHEGRFVDPAPTLSETGLQAAAARTADEH